MFQYHAKLNGSQTYKRFGEPIRVFQYHAKLNGSQTDKIKELADKQFQYHAKLNGSQTMTTLSIISRIVSVPC